LPRIEIVIPALVVEPSPRAAVHDLGLHHVCVAQRLAGAHRRRAASPTTSAGGAGSSVVNSARGRRSMMMSPALRISPRVNARVGTAASIVSTAVPE